ncbi:DUF2512 family protein [Thermoflavimicrobium dichotomicum]|uniref:4 TMS phage holin, superfamily IV n=1 Tax=Thermoflavimicrobium dichotomicum TaxID=46223 RepID=A0A1I3LHL0_9BACL|nr:DUF2512 family protein [Thermoflavimicrobium dichotomicum]SFI83885.1 Protein of unknown function [Thermoflavimicrobium dichotomicum]
MKGWIVKLFVCPAVVWISTFLFQDVYYPAPYQSLVTGLILAIVAHLMELMVLRPGTFWLSTGADFLAATVIVYISQWFFAGSRITWAGALLTAFFLAVTEYFQHIWLRSILSPMVLLSHFSSAS